MRQKSRRLTARQIAAMRSAFKKGERKSEQDAAAVLVPPMRDALARAIGALPAERAKALAAIAGEDR